MLYIEYLDLWELSLSPAPTRHLRPEGTGVNPSSEYRMKCVLEEDGCCTPSDKCTCVSGAISESCNKTN